MKLRAFPRTTEDPVRFLPTEIRLRRFKTNWGEPRFLVEARDGSGRCLGEKAFTIYADALAFAKMTAGWEGARLIDEVANAGG